MFMINGSYRLLDPYETLYEISMGHNGSLFPIKCPLFIPVVIRGPP